MRSRVLRQLVEEGVNFDNRGPQIAWRQMLVVLGGGALRPVSSKHLPLAETGGHCGSSEVGCEQGEQWLRDHPPVDFDKWVSEELNKLFGKEAE
jgi:hypothetical protein